MVRRWSYLNTLTRELSVRGDRGYLSLLPSYRLTLFKATTYYGKALFTLNLTKLVRRSFFRIRHVHNLLIYQNLLINWAREYLHLKKLSRVVFSFRLYKNTYVFQFATVYSSPAEQTFAPYIKYSLVSLTKSTFRAFGKFSNTFLKYFVKFPNLFFVLASAYKPITAGLSSGEGIPYALTGRSLTPPTSAIAPKMVFSSLMQVYWEATLLSLVELYKVFTIYIYAFLP